MNAILPSEAALDPRPPRSVPRSIVMLLSACCAASVANVYYAQPLLDSIARDFHISHSDVGGVITATQLGCALALMFVVPLGDLLDRKRLIAVQLVLLALACVLVAASRGPLMLLAGMVGVGLLGTAMTQGLIACAAALASEGERGRVVGAAQGGVVIGLLGLACVIAITDGSATPAGIALVIVGALAWSGANLVIKLSGTREVLAFLVWSSLFSPLPLFAIAWLQHGAAVYAATFAHFDGKAVFSILFQVYPTTLFGYGVWNLLLRKYPVSTVAPLSLLVPIFGMLGSALIFGEPIGPLKLLATALIVLGLAVGLYGKHLGARLARRAGT